MDINPTYFRNIIQLNKPTTVKEYRVYRSKNKKTYFFCDELSNEILIAKQKQKNKNIFVIIDNECNQLAEIQKSGYKTNKFHRIYKLYFKKKDFSQIIGIHKNNHSYSNTFYIPSIIEEGNGINSFKILEDIQTREKIVFDSTKFLQSGNFINHLKSIKNCQYYLDDSLRFELVKESSNKFKVYLDNPLSIVQGFMLALINIRI